MNKKLLNTVLAGVFMFGVATPKLSLFGINREAKNQERIEENTQVGNPETGNLENAKNRIRNFIGTRAAIGTGKVVSKDGSTLTIVSNENTYTVLTDDKTQFRRLFWGKSSLEEISINDMVKVIGKWQNEEKTQIKAILVRNLSIQKRHGTFFGVIKSVGENSLIIQTAQRGEITVKVTDTTKLVNRVMDEIVFSDLQVGHRIRVKGTWDKANSTLTEVIQVKDFSIPLISE
jgi:hypothetical protein